MYLIHLLVAHTITKSLLSFVHEIVCKLVWLFKIMHFVMFDANLIWNHSHALHVMKNLFKELFCRKVFGFSKILIFKGSINRTCFSINRNFPCF